MSAATEAVEQGKAIRTLIVHSRSWWASANPLREGQTEEIALNIDHVDGGTLMEAHVRFYAAAGGWRAEVFGESLAEAVEVGLIANLAVMRGDESPDTVVRVLEAAGWADVTEDVRP